MPDTHDDPLSTSGYRETVIAPLLDKYMDPAAIAYVVDRRDKSALRYLRKEIRDAANRPDTELTLDALPSADKTLEGHIEWWCREEYPDVTI
jgi:hypothetical protein